MTATITCPCGPTTTQDPHGLWAWSLHDCDGSELAGGYGYATEQGAQDAVCKYLREHEPDEPDPHCPICEGMGVSRRATRWEPAERCDCSAGHECRGPTSTTTAMHGGDHAP